MMRLYGNIELQIGYTSRTQQARRISEDWVARHAYCLRCESDEITPTSTNTEVCDFVCPQCEYGYELKSKCGVFTTRVIDGAYGAMLRTIRANRTPTFLLLEYSRNWSITGFTAIHHSLITEKSIVARKPLAHTARRAGWIGCSIVMPTIAVDGKIPIVRNERIEPPAAVRASFRKLENLSHLSHERRSWAATILNLIRKLPEGSFKLADAYEFEGELRLIYPENNNIRPKIRQQLQVLRDAGILIFLGEGRYQLVDYR
jgi:type II restriction enzyme